MSEYAANGGAVSSVEGIPSSLNEGFENDISWDGDFDDKTWDALDNDWLSEEDPDLQPYLRMRDHDEWGDDDDLWDIDRGIQDMEDLSTDHFDELETYNELDELPALNDPHPDTAEVTEHIIEEIQKAVFTQEVDGSLDEAHEKYGAEFDEAFHAVIESGNAPAAQRILSGENPGEELMRVFRQARLLSEIPDGDLNGWARQRFETLVQDALIQEAAQRAFLEATEQVLQEENIQQDRVYPPPSIIRAPGSSGPYRETVPLNAVSYAFGE